MSLRVTMKSMLEAGVHFGHKTSYWNPKMKPYIYGSRYSLHILNLEKTLPAFHAALDFISEVALNRGNVLWVGTKYVARKIIEEQAIRCGMPYISHRWPGGMLTNYMTVKNSIKRLLVLEAQLDKEDTQGLTKKEILQLTRERYKLNRSLGGVKAMNGLPDAVIVFDVGQEAIAVREAKRLRIPVIGIVDTNRSPDDIDYIIPGNDDSSRAIFLYAEMFSEVILKSRRIADQAAAERAKAVAIQKQTAADMKKERSAAGPQAKRTLVKRITKIAQPEQALGAQPKRDTATTAMQKSTEQKKSVSPDKPGSAAADVSTDKEKKASTMRSKKSVSTKQKATKSSSNTAAFSKEASEDIISSQSAAAKASSPSVKQGAVQDGDKTDSVSAVEKSALDDVE